MSYQPSLFTAPILADFAAFNTPTTTISTAYGLNFVEPSNSSANIVRGLTQAVATPAYTISTKVVVNNPSIGNQFAGIGLTDGTGIIMFCMNATSLVVRRYTDDVTFDTEPFSMAINNFANEIWFRLEDDTTDRNYYVSIDGVNYSLVYTESNTAYITPTDYGMFIDPFSEDINVTFQGWNKG